MDSSGAGLNGHDWLPDDGWADPDSLLGQLQRGRGLGLRRALATRASDVVLTCLGQNARWDRQLEERGSYMARLIGDLGIDLSDLPWDAAAPEMADSVVFDAVVELAAHGSVEAAGMLHAHVAQVPVEGVGEVAEALWDRGGPLVRDGLDALVLGRLDDVALTNAAWPYDDGPWAAWGDDPRVAAALRRHREEKAARVRGPRVPRPQLNRETVETLMELAADPDERGRAAVRELGRRGDLRALDLLERPELRNPSGWAPHLRPIAVELGPRALPRARVWLRSDDLYLRGLAETILADHGEVDDTPTIVKVFETAVEEGDWLTTEPFARALARLDVTEAHGALAGAWSSTQHSHARAAYLEALHALRAPETESLVAEARDDCESEVRELAASLG